MASGLAHRRFLAQPEAHRPFVGSDLLARIGGNAAIHALIDTLYDRIETDAALRPLFGRDSMFEREAQKRFFVEWLGGERAYSEHAYFPLKHRHDLLPITPALADKWLAHFRRALDSAVSDLEARATMYEHVRGLALALVNEHGPVSLLRTRSHGVCLRYPPAIESLRFARRGETSSLRMALKSAPEVLGSTVHAALLLHLAVVAGHRPVVELLVESGVDVNLPSPIQALIFVTPLCAARLKRRPEIEELLVRHGAEEDIFTHAFLGDTAGLEADLAREPASAQAVDPAVDALEITPIHHAVAGARVEALRLLLVRASRRNEPLLGGGRAIREAAAGGNVAIVGMLLDHGADATHIGAGRWVLHPQLAPMLACAGASVDRSGAWIGAACTGNQGRKDDPDYVVALLRYGARATDKRLTGQGSDGGHATALHYAAKAGFVKTIGVLLEHGADPNARDDNGLTPLDWLQRSAKSVDRDAVRRALVGT